MWIRDSGNYFNLNSAEYISIGNVIRQEEGTQIIITNKYEIIIHFNTEFFIRIGEFSSLKETKRFLLFILGIPIKSEILPENLDSMFLTIDELKKQFYDRKS